MSKIKELKSKVENNINVIELINDLINSDKSKYTELFTKVAITRFIENEDTNEFRVFLNDILSTLTYKTGKTLDVSNYTTFETIFLSNFLSYIQIENLNLFNKFIDYNERKLVEKNDLTTYKSFREIAMEVSKIDVKLFSKEFEKQVVTLYNDDEWLIIKPLTYDASRKYGAHTKWCTASATNSDYFFDYSESGILTYCINKKTGVKYGIFKPLRENEVSFWDDADRRIDSFYTEIPSNLLDILRTDFKTCKMSNKDFLSPSDRRKDKDMYQSSKKIRLTANEPQAGGAAPLIAINNRYDEEVGRDDMEDNNSLDEFFDSPTEESGETYEQNYRG